MTTALERIVANARRAAAAPPVVLPSMQDEPDLAAAVAELDAKVEDALARLADLEEIGMQEALQGMVPDGMTAALPEPIESEVSEPVES